ncbi:MAG: hypothetical protein JW730_16305 [Anaerolineales bacterium]|nr:hypothetical protein [Anaerolineales bacterium]
MNKNNPGIDTATWEGLRKKWSALEAAGHALKIEFKLVADPKDEENILAIDVFQHIDEEVITETVQRKAGEADATLGIAGLSMERLVVVYKGMMKQLHAQQAGRHDAELIVTMSPSSKTSGEIRGYLEKSDGKSSVQVDYQHYYVLNALREKMIEAVGDAWSRVRAVYGSDSLEFYFDY